MAGTNLQDNAMTQASQNNGFLYIVHKDVDGANPSSTDVLGATAGQVYKFYHSVGGTFDHGLQNVTQQISDAGIQLGAQISGKQWNMKFNVRGIVLNALKLFQTDGVYFKVGYYLPNKTGYMKYVFNLCTIKITGPITIANEGYHDYEVTITPISLETATADASGVGAQVVTVTEIAASSVTAIASATDV